MKKHVILFLAANPSSTSRLALDEECAAIERELSMTVHRDDFEFRSKWAATVDEMMRHLLGLNPTIIHFSGHGTGDQVRDLSATRDVVLPGDAPPARANGGIYLHGNQGGAQFVSARALMLMIKSAAASARVVVLNACYSNPQADAVRSVVDCVVGMTGAIGDDAARSFAVGFYRALGSRCSVGNAADQGVAMLAAKHLSDELLPRCVTRDGVDKHDVFLDSEVSLSSAPASTTSSTGRVLRGMLGLNGLSVLMLLVIVLEFGLAPDPPQEFDITVFLYGKTGYQSAFSRNHGKLSLDLGADRRTESVGDKGDIRFAGIPANLRGREIALVLESDSYELVDPSLKIRLAQGVFYAAVRPKQLRLAGYVSDERGRPLPQTRASVVGNVATTDQDGRFEMMLPADLSDGDRTITISASGYKTWRAHVAPGGNPLQVRLSTSPDGR